LTALAFTGFSLVVSPLQAQIGRFRPIAAIPAHLAVLVLLGAVLGVASSILAKKPGLTFLFLSPILVVLTDIDHLPSTLDVAQPIRPAHSFIFVALVMVVTAIVIRRLDIEATVLSAFLAHLSVDTGLFPPFSPVSFKYYNLAPYSLTFLAASVVFALLAGFLKRRKEMRRKD
jgi:hypothetical protein